MSNDMGWYLGTVILVWLNSSYERSRLILLSR
jgi:hypothetical protein